ncbi:GNAT family N-acetyltransferase [Ruminococcus sp. OA3]|uniref:GNAT family N-acetyltransferase n=1 Tax=Ruminococcus sp. OA3 TaxID=2914164 RepID=UPI0031F5B91A
MQRLRKDQKIRIAPLFKNFHQSMVHSCLENRMGCAYADNTDAPVSAQIIIGAFSFLAGRPDENLVRNIPPDYDASEILMIPENETWDSLIELVWGRRARRFTRYAIKKEPGVFNDFLLNEFINRLPDGYSLQMIDENIYQLTFREDWSRDLCALFPSYENYREHGIGAGVLYKGLLVSGASSYAVSNGSIEIEVDTRPEYRKKGLALACCAKLILECRQRGLYPGWDAHDLRSVSLAERLGYHLDYSYTAYCVTVPRKNPVAAILLDMPLQELWTLFPIILREHNTQYKKWYRMEKNCLLQLIEKDQVIQIHHIGSTSVEGLIAKPIVDILMEIAEDCNIVELKSTLESSGWICMSESYMPELKLVFNKGYTPNGFASQVYHLHIRYFGDWDELYFRDYLILHENISRDYAVLKQKLAMEYKNDRDSYTKAKTAFIKEYTQKARAEFKNRYAPDRRRIFS